MRSRVPTVAALVLLAGGLVALAASYLAPPQPQAEVHAEESPARLPSPPPSPEPSPSPSPSPEPPMHRFVDRRGVGQPWGTVEGLTMFRGNPTRTWYGLGPVPTAPEILWRYPDRPMCGPSTVGGQTRTWCGTGWTGQPVVWERPDGVTEIIVGAYDHHVHFLDAATGEPTRPRFRTGDLVKGSGTLDPDGFPLYYFGSRDNRLRVLALDRDEPTELWALHPHPQGIWNTDWDGNPAIVDDLMFVGGEDSWFRVVKLNRGYDPDGRVTVDPEVVFEMRGWTDELLRNIGDRNVSIENSVALFEGRVYFANSGGRVVGHDITNVEAGEAEVVFDFWTGDDTDATIVIDEEGMLYVAVELERFLPRAREVGQLVKLDPYQPDDPIVWSVHVPPRRSGEDGGIWSTPALHAGMVYVHTHPGELIGVDATTGEVVWRHPVAWHSWSSPVVVDEVLIAPSCDGVVRAWRLDDPRDPTPYWEVAIPTGSCIESTVAVWKGGIYVGSRDGFFYAFGDPR